MYGQCTNSGGGGTDNKLYVTHKNLGVTAPICSVTSYSLHNLQTGLRNGVQLVLDEGGLDNEGKGKLNDIQILHRVYSLKNWHECEELKYIYLFTQKKKGLKEKFKKLEETIFDAMVAGRLLYLRLF